MTEIKWYARGGQGGFTASRLLGLAAVQAEGTYAQAFPSFGPERRGAPVYGFTRIDSKPIRDHSQIYRCDYAVVLDSTLMDRIDVSAGLKPGGVLFVNTRKAAGELNLPGVNVVTYDAAAVTRQILGAPISNTAMLTVMAISSRLAGKQDLIQAVRLGLPPGLVDKNIELIEHVHQVLSC